jgi:hypothetical protein
MFAPLRGRRSATRPVTRTRLGERLEALEDRSTPSTTSSIAASFNGTAIPAGDTIWFNSAFTASGLPAGATVTFHVENQAVGFTSGGTNFHVALPNAVIVLTPGATSARASFDPTDNDWDVSAPTGGTGNVFMGGAGFPVATGLPGGIKNVTWTGSFWSDTANTTLNWKWGAAAYNSFPADPNALSVKPVDNNSLSAYTNNDHAGTPEAMKTYVMAGATGGGGTNYTGNLSPAAKVTSSLGSGYETYPFQSSNPLTSIAFNESTVLKTAALDTTNGYFKLWYSDEHALALGVRQVNVTTATGTATTNYAVSPLTSDPGSATNPTLGSTATSGDQAGTDLSTRPVSPYLYITDITTNPNSLSGDWQYGGTGYAPNAVFGAWKGVVRTVNNTTATPTVTVTCDTDPAQNGWNLGTGADAPPAGVTSEGYGAEVRWNLADLQQQGVLTPGRTYRFYVMVHDGDQNKSGGDAGQAAFVYTMPGSVVVQPATLSGTVRDILQNAQAGLTVTLTGTDSNNNPVTATTTTDVFGHYSFPSLAAGTYTITLTYDHTQWVAANPNQIVGSLGGQGSDGTISAISLNGINGTDYDFTLIPPQG